MARVLDPGIQMLGTSSKKMLLPREIRSGTQVDEEIQEGGRDNSQINESKTDTDKRGN